MEVNFNELEGKVIIDVIKKDNSITFKTNKQTYVLEHEQYCCEDVLIDDICGDLKDLINETIIKAEKVTNDKNINEKEDKSFTWTFFHISTIKTNITIKFYGTSNGYYSETAELYLIEEKS